MTTMAEERCSARLRKYLLEKAKMHAVARDWESAFSHYLLAIKVDCTAALEIIAAFAFCFEQWLAHLRSLKQEGEIGNAFVKAKAVCFFSDSLMSLLADQAIRLGQQKLAIGLLEEAMSSFPSSLKVAEAWEHVTYDAVERWHFRMLNDGARNQNYHDAILQTVKENNIKTVLDIGCGTGLLSLFALEAGAASVAMCDAAPVMAGICTAVISENCKPATFSHSLLFTKHSTSLSVPDDLPTRQDLLVTEIFDVALFGEQCLPTLLHAWSHLLYNSPDKKSQIIPQGAKMYVCAIQCEEIRRENFVHLQNVPLLNLAMLNILGKTALVEGDPYTSENLFFIRNSYRFLSPIQHLLWIDFSNPEALEALTHHSHQLALDIYTDGCVDALAVWFDLHLTEGLTVSTQPSARGCWEQAIFPVMMKTASLSGTYYTPAVVKTGDQLQVECKVRNNCLHLELLKVNSSGFFVKPSPADFSTLMHNHTQHRWKDCQKHSFTDKPKNGSLLGDLHLTVSKTLGEKENTVCASSFSRGEISNKTCCCKTKCAETDLYEMCYCETNHHETKKCYSINSGHHQAGRHVANIDPSSKGTENILTCRDSYFLHTAGDSPENKMSSTTGMVCPVNVEGSKTDSEQHTVCKDRTDMVCSMNVEGSTTDSKHNIVYKVRTDSSACGSLDEKRKAVQEQTCNHLRTSQHGGNASDVIRVHQDTFFIEREVIRQFNDLKCSTLFQTALHYARTKIHSQGRVLNLSTGFPLVGLLALKQGFQHACLHVHPDLDGTMRHDLQMLACCIAQHSNISGEEWSWWEHGDPVIGDETVDVIVADLVDVNGSLDSRLVEELFTFSCILNQEGLVIPQKVDIFAVLIDSSQLQSMSFASDSNTLGYSISTHINAFKTRTFLELDIHTLPREELTDVCHIFHLNLQSAILVQDSSSMRAHRLEVEFSQSRQLPVRVRKTGQATAVVFWFNLTLAPGVHLCTLDAATHWKQAAFVLDARQVREGDEVILEARLSKSFLHFQLL